MRRLGRRVRELTAARTDDRLTTWLARIAAGAGLLNLLVLIVQARATIRSLRLSADVATTFVLPALARDLPAGSIVTVGDHAYYETWWFDRMTAGLPDARAIWEVAPFVVVALGIALVAWCAWVALGGVAAVLSSVALVSLSAGWIGILGNPGGRGSTAVHAGALCAVLLILAGASRAPRLARGWLAVLTVLTVAFGVLAAADELVAATVVVPYMIAPCLWWYYDRSRAAARLSAYAILTGATSLAGAALLTAHMESEHIVHASFPVLFTTVASLAPNVQAMLGSWAQLGDGQFLGVSAAGGYLLAFVAGTLSLLALACVLWALSRTGRALLLAVSRKPPAPPARVLYVAFWGCVLAVDLTLYLLTNAPQQGSNYLLSGWIAVAALLGAFLGGGRLRAAALAGVALFAALTFRTHVVDGVPAYGLGPTPQRDAEIAQYARAHRAIVGYAEYLDAMPIMWQTRLRTRVYPIEPCPVITAYCPGPFGISSWYIPRGNKVNSFFLADSRDIAGAISGPPSEFGKAATFRSFGSYTVYVYHYDIAVKLGSMP